jgi:hypothetical protein
MISRITARVAGIPEIEVIDDYHFNNDARANSGTGDVAIEEISTVLKILFFLRPSAI